MGGDKNIVKLLRLIALLLIITIAGTLGFHWIEGWSLFDSLYMAVITLTTVGYQEVHPLSDGGRVFVLIYLVSGLGLSFYGLAQLGEVILKAQFFEWLGQKRKTSMIKNVANHFIVCGMGRMGFTLCQQLRQSGVDVVAIEEDISNVDDALVKQLGIHLIIGDATDDQNLLKARIDKAKGLASVLGSDADNLFVVLSARLLENNLQIIARSSNNATKDKLIKAGANRVVSPYTAGAGKMAQLLTHPKLSDIFDWEVAGSAKIEMAEIKVESTSPYHGLTLADTDLSKKGVQIVAIRRPTGAIEFPPKSSSQIAEGDYLLALGRRSDINQVLG